MTTSSQTGAGLVKDCERRELHGAAVCARWCVLATSAGDDAVMGDPRLQQVVLGRGEGRVLSERGKASII